MAKNKITPKESASQCDQCLPAYCCNYFAFGIEEPETRKDYDSLLWKLAHDKVSLYIYRNDWYIMIHTKCHFLTADNKCAIYDHRPHMCREHSTQNCEYTGDEYGFTEHFKNYDDLLIYIKENTKFRFKQEPKGLPANCI